MTGRFTESTVEETALAWLEAIGWQVAHGPDIALCGRRAQAGVKDAEQFLNRRGKL